MRRLTTSSHAEPRARERAGGQEARSLQGHQAHGPRKTRATWIVAVHQKLKAVLDCGHRRRFRLGRHLGRCMDATVRPPTCKQRYQTWVRPVTTHTPRETPITHTHKYTRDARPRANKRLKTGASQSDPRESDRFPRPSDFAP